VTVTTGSLQQGKTGILGNCVFATFSKNIKQLTYAGCVSLKFLSTPLDSVWIGSIATNLLPNFRRCTWQGCWEVFCKNGLVEWCL